MATNKTTSTLRVTAIREISSILDKLPNSEDREAVWISISSIYGITGSASAGTGAKKGHKKNKKSKKTSKSSKVVNTQQPTEMPEGGWGDIPMNSRMVDGRTRTDLNRLISRLQTDYEKYYPSQRHADREASSSETPPATREAYRDTRMYLQDCLQFLKTGQYNSVRSGKVSLAEKPVPPDSFRELLTKETDDAGNSELEAHETVQTVSPEIQK